MSSVLDDILAATRREIAGLRRLAPGRVAIGRTPIDAASLLRRDIGAPLGIIAEIKRRSPSAGALSRVLSAGARARAYADAGAAMISVLVDRAHFDGGYDHLAEARGAVPDVPVLCKGFILDEVQIDAALTAGADAVLLIVRILGDDELGSLVRATCVRRMTPIVEVTDERELDRALRAGADVVGVNARDLESLQIDAVRADRVLDQIPTDRVALFFSGVRGEAEVARIAGRGARRGTSERIVTGTVEGGAPGYARIVDGALIGEALMRCDDPGPLLRAMVAAASR